MQLTFPMHVCGTQKKVFKRASPHSLVSVRHKVFFSTGKQNNSNDIPLNVIRAEKWVCACIMLIIIKQLRLLIDLLKS